MYVRVSIWNTIGDNMNLEKILDKITKKVDQVEKMHDKESMLCEEIKDLVEEARENSIEENQEWEKDEDNEFEDNEFEDDEEEDIDEEEEK